MENFSTVSSVPMATVAAFQWQFGYELKLTQVENISMGTLWPSKYWKHFEATLCYTLNTS